MRRALRWLPSCALESAQTADWVAPYLAEWSAMWLAAGTLAPLAGWRATADRAAGFAKRHDCGNGMMLSIEAEGARLLAGAMLGRKVAERDLKSCGDRAVIDDLLRLALEDLAQRIERPANTLPAAGEGPVHRLPIGLEGQEVLTIEAPAPSVVAMAITMAGSPHRRAAPEKRITAIQSQRVEIAGLLGRDRFRLTDLEELDVGDVLPLTSDATVPLDLLLGGTRVGPGATLSREGDRFILQIERRPSEWLKNPA